jgi:hypothetical protein
MLERLPVAKRNTLAFAGGKTEHDHLETAGVMTGKEKAG